MLVRKKLSEVLSCCVIDAPADTAAALLRYHDGDDFVIMQVNQNGMKECEYFDFMKRLKARKGIDRVLDTARSDTEVNVKCTVLFTNFDPWFYLLPF